MNLLGNRAGKVFTFLFYAILIVSFYVVTQIGLVELLNMRFHGIDFCLYDNALWNAAQGTWLHCDLKHSWSYLGTHFSLILFLFVPFYWLGVGPWFLILVRSLAMAGGAWCVRYYARRNTGLSDMAADIIGISFLLHPMVHMAVLSEFHGMVLELFFVPFFFVALGSKKRGFIWGALFLLLAVREDTWLYTAGVALLLLWKEDRKFAWKILAVSVAWGGLALFVFMPFFQRGWGDIGGGNAQFMNYLTRYGHYHLSALKSRLVTDLRMLLPLAFLPLFGGKYLLLMLIPLIQIQSGQIRYQIYLLSHYSSCIIPFAYLAGIHGWKNIETFFRRKGRFRKVSVNTFRIVMGGVMLGVSLAGLRSSVVVQKKYPFIFQYPLVHLRERTAYKILEKIPKGASLSLQGSLLLIGAHRPVYLFSGYPPKTGYPSRKTEYLMVDLGRDFPLVKNYWREIVKVLKSGDYGVVRYEDGYVLLKRGNNTHKNRKVLHDIFYKVQGEAMHYDTGHWTEAPQYDWKAARVAKRGKDARGVLGFGSHRVLVPGKYHVVVRLFLEGVPGKTAGAIVVKGGEKKSVLLNEEIRFSAGSTIKKFSFDIFVKHKMEVEPVFFYNGIGMVGLDYVEFNRV